MQLENLMVEARVSKLFDWMNYLYNFTSAVDALRNGSLFNLWPNQWFSQRLTALLFSWFFPQEFETFWPVIWSEFLLSIQYFSSSHFLWYHNSYLFLLAHTVSVKSSRVRSIGRNASLRCLVRSEWLWHNTKIWRDEDDLLGRSVAYDHNLDFKQRKRRGK